MVNVKSEAGSANVSDGTLLVVLGGMALLAVGTVWWTQRQVEKTVVGGVKYIEELPAEIIGGAGQIVQDTGSGALDAAAASGEYYGKLFYGDQPQATPGMTPDQIAAAARRIEENRASGGFSNYGTVGGSLGPFTGKWFKTQGKAGDSCHVLFANASSSNATKFFTGGYCRQARAQGLID